MFGVGVVGIMKGDRLLLNGVFELDPVDLAAGYCFVGAFLYYRYSSGRARAGLNFILEPVVTGWVMAGGYHDAAGSLKVGQRIACYGRGRCLGEQDGLDAVAGDDLGGGR